MQMQLGSEAQIPDGLLAANALLGENSHQGVPTSTHALYKGFGFVISNTALGLKRSLYDEGVRSRYTGKERDTESGLDYFGARYYSSNMGRMMSPDPSGLAYADPTNPQSFNLYSYVLNNPLKFTDPTGLYCYWDDGSSDDDPSDGGASKGDCGSQGGTWTDLNNPCKGADGCSTTTNNNPKEPTLDDIHNFYNQWIEGTLPPKMVYLENSGWTKQLARSGPAQRIRAQYIKDHCPATGGGPSGHFSPFLDAYVKSPFTGSPNYAEMQVGGFNESITTSSGSTNYTITNTASMSSFSGASTIGDIAQYISPFAGDGIDDNTAPTGPEHNVDQTFAWSETGACPQ